MLNFSKVGCRPCTKPVGRNLMLSRNEDHDEVEKRRTGDRRTAVEDFHGIHLPVKIIPRPDFL